ncbi:hypothetical protein DRE_00323 [Drechslerella stenobrocha 248]|uniref:Uncharacterized protein n=1 Tax=Drechslerella stenobrocha 248 TaxID=1043628 RepID=W7IEA2_9PEZI|nr:hypothetical protein DRE_00323 [Drechslerella stenobrocha 248]
MSHQRRGGYFYLKYSYQAYYTLKYYDKQGNRIEDPRDQDGNSLAGIRRLNDGFVSAYYEASPQSHQRQSRWLQEKARPAVEADIRRWIAGLNEQGNSRLLRDLERNRAAKAPQMPRPVPVYESYSWTNVIIEPDNFRWQDSLPAKARNLAPRAPPRPRS